MSDLNQQQIVMKMIDASAAKVGAAVASIVIGHGIGANTQIAVRDSNGQEIHTTFGQLMQQQFEATVDLTEAIDDLIEAVTPAARKKPTPKRRKK